MADITNPEAVRFCNEKARPTSDGAVAYYYYAKRLLQKWDATGMASLIPNTSDIVDDGSATDGRSPITGAKVHGFHDHLQEMVNDLEANNNLKLNILLQFQVNGVPRWVETL